MQNEKALSVSIYFLAICIIISAVIISNGLKSNGNYVNGGLSGVSNGLSNIGSSMNNDNSAVYNRSTFDLPAAAAYLGISVSKLIDILNSKDSGIPYIKSGSDYIFSKGALDKWLETARVEIK